MANSFNTMILPWKSIKTTRRIKGNPENFIFSKKKRQIQSEDSSGHVRAAHVGHVRAARVSNCQAETMEDKVKGRSNERGQTAQQQPQEGKAKIYLLKLRSPPEIQKPHSILYH